MSQSHALADFNNFVVFWVPISLSVLEATDGSERGHEDGVTREWKGSDEVKRDWQGREEGVKREWQGIEEAAKEWQVRDAAMQEWRMRDRKWSDEGEEKHLS